MYGPSVGIAYIGSTLPSPVYALLSRLNAATVGIIALAAVRLSERAISDKITRFLVYPGGIMGILHAALWYYPIIMTRCGLATLIWDPGYGRSIEDCFKKLRWKSPKDVRFKINNFGP
jgi:chromate transport protein ChrA